MQHVIDIRNQGNPVLGFIPPPSIIPDLPTLRVIARMTPYDRSTGLEYFDLPRLPGPVGTALDLSREFISGAPHHVIKRFQSMKPQV